MIVAWTVAQHHAHRAGRAWLTVEDLEAGFRAWLVADEGEAQ